MCDFCRKIRTYKEYESAGTLWEKVALAKDEDGTIYLRVPCIDWHYSEPVGIANYCPICGRKLSRKLKGD